MHNLWMRMNLAEGRRGLKALGQMVFGSIFFALLALLAKHINLITDNFNDTILTLSALVISFSLYRLKIFLPLAYGFLEINIGFWGIKMIMARDPGNVDPGILMVQLAAGIYIMIRGIDNCAQSEFYRGFKEWYAERKRVQNKD